MKRFEITHFDLLDYAANEALNTLTTNLSFAGPDVRRIMLTSCQPQEGKSFMSMNLMRSLAHVGKRVVLVDADLRKSVLLSRYGIRTNDQILGLSHYLADMATMEDVLFETNIPGAYMVPVGQDVINSLTLLNTPRLSRLLNGLAKAFDVVLVDAPPVGIIIDAAQIARSCDGVLFVVASDTVTRRELMEATEQIQKTGCPILGAVINKLSFDKHLSKKYYHKTYYTHYNKEYYVRSKDSDTKTRTPKAKAGANKRKP